MKTNRKHRRALGQFARARAGELFGWHLVSASARVQYHAQRHAMRRLMWRASEVVRIGDELRARYGRAA